MTIIFTENDQPTPYLTHFWRFFWGLFKAAANVGKFFFAPIGGAACAAIDIYDIYHHATNPYIKQRKSNIAASFLSLAANALFTAGSILALFNPFNLIIVACSAAIPFVFQSYYSVQCAERDERRYRHSPPLLDEAHEDKFTSRCNMVFKTLKLAANVLLFAGFFFAPLLIAGAALLATTVLFEHYEKATNYACSRKIAGLFACKETTSAAEKPIETKEFSPKNLDEQFSHRRKPLPKSLIIKADMPKINKRLQQKRSHQRRRNMMMSGLELQPIQQERKEEKTAVPILQRQPSLPPLRDWHSYHSYDDEKNSGFRLLERKHQPKKKKAVMEIEMDTKHTSHNTKPMVKPASRTAP